MKKNKPKAPTAKCRNVKLKLEDGKNNTQKYERIFFFWY